MGCNKCNVYIRAHAHVWRSVWVIMPSWVYARVCNHVPLGHEYGAIHVDMHTVLLAASSELEETGLNGDWAGVSAYDCMTQHV